MADPRIFFLGGRQTTELPLDWYQRRTGEPVTEAHAIEVTRGVRVQILAWGTGILPTGRAGNGAWIAVWADPAP